MKDNAIKILIVDDKKENLLSLQVILADRGYQFVEATSGKDALRILLKNQDFAIILMDVQMPLMDGFETAELIRQSDKLKHVPIIFLTANMNTNEYIFKGYQSGAVDYMIKPLAPEILQAKVMVFTELFRKNQELKKKEEETQALNEIILKNNAKLASQYEAIAKHAEELKKKNMELDAFTYISSHDLQEPLRKIQTFANLIMANEYPNLSEDGKARFNRILYATNRMRELINSLLTFSRATLDDRRFETVDLNAIIADVKAALYENLSEKNAVIVTDFHDNIKAIPFQFVQLMENMIHNAIKFSQPEIPLQITIKSRFVDSSVLNDVQLLPNVKYCHISFGDNGIGFEQEHNEKIFGVFQKLHGRDLYEGTGIGLAIVKKIIENHDGFINATGEPMKGATFNIYIPY
ncbi:sensor histidine kinase [Flavobacterium hydrophilum]|uniref:histidine kinase n=1 Tax=Flavobacterium hydrophilum TaxID=2211445 RepID=A0A2V4C5T6_9FLAO|nr:response regulator [Flavobacterium hydrophilum]PXY46347.1 hybrid sensor histidine kinase/response regulator [Flavobacterium hydrophilum]